MIFKGIDNQIVEISIRGYEFPNSDDKEYDGNWLIIYLRVESKLGNWQTIYPCLLTWEIKSLIDWLKKISENEENIEKEMEFIEPNISFHLLNNFNDFAKVIRINFDLEFRPSSNKYSSYFVDLLMNSKELLKISKELEIELEKFPERK